MILDKFPGTPRDAQAFALTTMEENWDKFDVFVLQLPVATGKSRVAITLSRWAKGSAIITPTNILQQQYTAEFPRMPTLWRRSSYYCGRHDQSCESTKRREGGACRGCPYVTDVRRAHASSVGVYNYYTYLSHKLYRPVLIADEAHQLLPMIQDMAAVKLWKHDWHYPDTLRSVSDIQEWISSLPAGLKEDRRLARLEREVEALTPSTLIHRSSELWRNKEYRDVLKLIPLTTKDEPPLLWPPGKVDKIVLMSATISEKDIEEMGLGGHRVMYIDCESPIPPDNRPVVFEPAGNMSYRHQPTTLPLLANKIKELLARHQDKGIIHCTYGIAWRLRKLLADQPRLRWHTKDNKSAQYQEFRESSPDSGEVLVASGLYEGVDLPHDMGRWQAVCKVPYLSLGDPGIRAKQQEDPEWYAWEAIKTVLQASGRICRTPDDHGITYLLDSAWETLYSRHEGLVPDWFTAAYRKETA